jgi:hypothetical protein
MRTVRTSIIVDGAAIEAEQLWHDRARWSSWIDGFGRVVKLEGEWPLEGARRVFESRDGQLAMEIVTGYTAGDAQTLSVEDARVAGERRVRFESDNVRTRITLELEVEPKERLPPARKWWLRRKLAESMRRTLARFAIELAAER